MNKNIFLFTIILFFISACSKINFVSKDKAILGNWKLLNSSGGISGGGETDIDLNFANLEFKKNGHYNFEKSSTNTTTGKYKFENGKTIDGNNEKLLHCFDKFSYKILNDTLYLNPIVYDGLGYTFIKK